MTLSSLGYYIVSNRFKLEATFGLDFGLDAERDEIIRISAELLLAYLLRR